MLAFKLFFVLRNKSIVSSTPVAGGQCECSTFCTILVYTLFHLRSLKGHEIKLYSVQAKHMNTGPTMLSANGNTKSLPRSLWAFHILKCRLHLNIYIYIFALWFTGNFISSISFLVGKDFYGIRKQSIIMKDKWLLPRQMTKNRPGSLSIQFYHFLWVWEHHLSFTICWANVLKANMSIFT